MRSGLLSSGGSAFLCGQTTRLPRLNARHYPNTTTADQLPYYSPAPILLKLMTQPHSSQLIIRHYGACSQVIQEDRCDQYTSTQHTWIAACETDHPEIQQDQHASTIHT
jgi:hypothetical protein